ncbi:hypothetical protein [uncultured Tenacibaculum sp.]|uniref:hypothetical protein n=1 Tax=uncultured Tenacibaculum sp. TaxID=174713 RepID=UPI00261E3833|nr:hypothetical protein [uncultured Tenacibaculum sp.]
MKKSILNLGEVLTKEKLQKIKGGYVWICTNSEGVEIWVGKNGGFYATTDSLRGKYEVEVPESSVAYICNLESLTKAEKAAGLK